MAAISQPATTSAPARQLRDVADKSQEGSDSDTPPPTTATTAATAPTTTMVAAPVVLAPLPPPTVAVDTDGKEDPVDAPLQVVARPVGRKSAGSAPSSDDESATTTTTTTAAKGKKSAAGARKPAPKAVDFDSDDADAEVATVAAVSKGKKVAKKPTPKAVAFDSDDDEPAVVAVAAKKAAPKAVDFDSDEDAAPVSKPGKGRTTVSFDSDEEAPVKATAGTKPVAVGKAGAKAKKSDDEKQVHFDDSKNQVKLITPRADPPSEKAAKGAEKAAAKLDFPDVAAAPQRAKAVRAYCPAAPGHRCLMCWY